MRGDRGGGNKAEQSWRPAAEHHATVAAVMRDSYEIFRRVWVKWLLPVQSLMLANTCRTGLQLLTTTVYAKLILETDSKILTDLWNSQTFDRSEVATTLADI
jgi:hypothetical protein